MADGRNSDAAKKGWQTRRARLRVVEGMQNQQYANAQISNRLQDYANSINVTLQEAKKVYQGNLGAFHVGDDRNTACREPRRNWWARFCDWLDRG